MPNNGINGTVKISTMPDMKSWVEIAIPTKNGMTEAMNN
jgi:hypothetical protein